MIDTIEEVPSVDEIIDTVCNYFGITEDGIKGPGRKRVYSDPRSIAMKIIKDNHPKLSYLNIGLQFGGRDHSTVLYNRDKFDDLSFTKKRYKADYQDILKQIAERVTA